MFVRTLPAFFFSISEVPAAKTARADARIPRGTTPLPRAQDSQPGLRIAGRPLAAGFVLHIPYTYVPSNFVLLNLLYLVLPNMASTFPPIICTEWRDGAYGHENWNLVHGI